VGNVLYFLVAFSLHCLAFWADNVWSLLVALRLVSNLLGGLMIPLAAWPDAAQPWLAALPFRHFYAEPVRALLGQADAVSWLSSLGAAVLWCGAFALLARFAFERGRLRYSGPGM
jgi:ABC-2 type transport system permease protein